MSCPNERTRQQRILEALDHMSDTSDENPTFMSTVETLSEELNKHIAEEEDQIFPLLRIRWVFVPPMLDLECV